MQNNFTSEEKILQEKARQVLKRNKALIHAPIDEGGLLAGPAKTKALIVNKMQTNAHPKSYSKTAAEKPTKK